METSAGLKQLEGTLALACDKVSALKAKLDDLVFRAQRIASAQKAGQVSTDTMFGYDLQHFRRDLRGFSGEIQTLPAQLGAVERGASYDEKAVKLAQEVMRQTTRFAMSLRGLHDTAVLAHQHIRAADLKIEAWYIAQEVEELVGRGQGLPMVANKVVISLSTPAASPPPTI